MKKLLLLIACMVASHALAYTWTIKNNTAESIDVKVDAEIPGGRKELRHYSVTLEPNDKPKTISTGFACVYKVSASWTNNPDIADIWYPAVIWECPGRTITVTSKDNQGLKITVGS